MAVVDILSGALTNRDTVPIDFMEARRAGGNVKCAVGTLEVNSGDSANSTYRLCEVPSNAVILAVEVSCDALGGSCAANFGLYQTTENGSAVVDADAIGSAVSLASALANSNITHESAVFGLDEMEDELWSVLGLSEDSDRAYDVVATLTAATAAAGTLGIRVYYADSR